MKRDIHQSISFLFSIPRKMNVEKIGLSYWLRQDIIVNSVSNNFEDLSSIKAAGDAQ
jgi:hypothetical protein